MKYIASLSIILLLADCSAPDDLEKRVFYVNSYHSGYGTSQALVSSLKTYLPDSNMVTRIAYLDAKRLDSASLKTRAIALTDTILAFKPDVLIVSDDNAVQSLLIPNIKRFTFPVVFCGVNWSAEQYNLPRGKVTGMVEVLPVKNCIELLRRSGYTLNRITVLSEDSSPERKNREAITPQLKSDSLEVHYEMVSDFNEWKEAFIKAQEESDVLFIPTNGAIRGWDHAAAIRHVKENSKKPVFTCDDFMLAYACFGFTKVTAEQTRFAAMAAVQILSGKKINSIPITQNKETEFWINNDLIRRTDLKLQTRDISGIKYYTYE